MLVNAVAVSDGMQATSWTVSCGIHILVVLKQIFMITSCKHFSHFVSHTP